MDETTCFSLACREQHDSTVTWSSLVGWNKFNNLVIMNSNIKVPGTAKHPSVSCHLSMYQVFIKFLTLRVLLAGQFTCG